MCCTIGLVLVLLKILHLVLVILLECLIFAEVKKQDQSSMENILIVVGILIIGSAMGGTQLPKLPGAILSLGALFVALFNSHARENMGAFFFIIPVLFVAVGILSYLSEKKLIAEGASASSKDQFLGGSIFQVVFILLLTIYFVSTFFYPFYS